MIWHPDFIFLRITKWFLVMWTTGDDISVCLHTLTSTAPTIWNANVVPSKMCILSSIHCGTVNATLYFHKIANTHVQLYFFIMITSDQTWNRLQCNELFTAFDQALKCRTAQFNLIFTQPKPSNISKFNYTFVVFRGPVTSVKVRRQIYYLQFQHCLSC